MCRVLALCQILFIRNKRVSIGEKREQANRPRSAGRLGLTYWLENDLKHCRQNSASELTIDYC